eukprot:CAMPEP_0172621960 /NCGR_PEP_ID=MMETSP1068-20121228/116892_1 /TAXON_ID=35684 /ORGANISM="Pseudopedinella elastica, Strain CCMP716" /LENGTH=100 /DNA_ID=CAMNT_0013429953 /DNA_START=35 /DNA_END=337 /DNA_ORIENTATION=-
MSSRTSRSSFDFGSPQQADSKKADQNNKTEVSATPRMLGASGGGKSVSGHIRVIGDGMGGQGKADDRVAPTGKGKAPQREVSMRGDILTGRQKPKPEVLR